MNKVLQKALAILIIGTGLVHFYPLAFAINNILTYQPPSSDPAAAYVVVTTLAAIVFIVVGAYMFDRTLDPTETR